jgi:hypothetical protein
MEIEQESRAVRSFKALEDLLASIEDRRVAKPDWIKLKDKADLSRLEESDLVALLSRLHAGVLRGFTANDVRVQGRRQRLAYWRSIASHGFHDFAEDKWSKGYDSPFVEDYDYIAPYLAEGLGALDPYVVYSSVLGTWEYAVEDFLATELGSGLQTIVEPMAGSAEFSYAGHFRNPELSYCMIDLDESAKSYVENKAWLEKTRREYLIGDILDEQTWKDARAFSRGTSLSYIGKQSHNYFDVRQLVRLMELGTTHSDHLMLEVSEPYLLDEEPSLDELTRPEQKAAGFSVALEDDETRISNPLTNELNFYLVAWDREDRRELFSYRDWTGWQAPMLTALGRLLDLEVRYFHDHETEFLPVDEGTETAECRSNNTFMLFSRR